MNISTCRAAMSQSQPRFGSNFSLERSTPVDPERLAESIIMQLKTPEYSPKEDDAVVILTANLPEERSIGQIITQDSLDSFVQMSSAPIESTRDGRILSKNRVRQAACEEGDYMAIALQHAPKGTCMNVFTITNLRKEGNGELSYKTESQSFTWQESHKLQKILAEI